MNQREKKPKKKKKLKILDTAKSIKMNDKQDTTPLTYIGNDNAKAFIQKKANIQHLLECVVFCCC